ncbi:MAG TPA: V-type ATP synthase subunit A, partial [Candidatus Bathyarchaeota archaeon]|nr:V-type ATP synthase subunit A [Candidatus Bathyarchaeota archaeon]
MKVGKIIRINGPLVIAEDVPNAKIGDIVHLGHDKLIGEIVRMFGNKVACQCYEDTTGLRPGEPVENTGEPLAAELGPGLIGQIFDGLQFSEIDMWKAVGPFMKRGVKLARLSRDREWEFTPRVKPGDKVVGGDIIGEVPETSVITHRVMVPPDLRGEVVDVQEGKFHVTDTVATLRTPDGKTVELTLMQTWPVRFPRPYRERLPLVEPLITGQRVIDIFFPVAKGGAAAIPGGFGTGKT